MRRRKGFVLGLERRLARSGASAAAQRVNDAQLRLRAFLDRDDVAARTGDEDAGSDVVALTARIGVAAGLSVREGDGAPAFCRCKPSQHPAVTSPLGFSEEPVPEKAAV